MPSYLIMCRSLTYAQRSARALERAGITAIVMKAPPGTTSAGCAYCLKVSQRRLDEAVSYLDNAGLPHGKIYYYSADGAVTEVVR